MTSGKNKVSAHLFALVALSAASLAGRPGENGTGAMWIAPELVESYSPLAAGCSLPARIRNVELRFEKLDPREIDAHAPQLTADNRDIVDFEWNPATSELRFRANAGSSVFSDLALPSTGEPVSPASCESR